MLPKNKKNIVHKADEQTKELLSDIDNVQNLEPTPSGMGNFYLKY